MPSYGNYQVDREIASGHGAVVYTARPPGQTGAAPCVVKVFSPNLLTLLDAGAKEELDSLYAGLAEAVVKRIEIQKQAGAISKFVAPVLEQGHEGSSVWYATPFYPQSAEKVLNARVQLNKAAITHILLSVVRGALALKQACGRSHGNLKPTNVFLGAAAKVHTATVVVADPLPGEAGEATAFELADLKAVGQFLYQFVRRKPVPADEWDGMVLPLDLNSEWTAVFGKEAPQWLALCNRLLDRQLSLATFDLAKLEQELSQITPVSLGSRLALPVGVGGLVLLLLGGAYFVWLWMRKGVLVVTNNVPGATLVIKDRDGKPVQPETTMPGLSLTNFLRSGNYSVEVSYRYKSPVGTNILWSTNLAAKVQVQTDKPSVQRFDFPYGRLSITSAPPTNASIELVEINGVPLPTPQSWGNAPATYDYLPQWRYGFKVKAQGHSEEFVKITAESDRPVTRGVVLTVERATDGRVYFVNLRDLPLVISSGDKEKLVDSSLGLFIAPQGRQVFRVHLAPWPDQFFTNDITAGQRLTNQVDWPCARLTFTSAPTNALVLATAGPWLGEVGRTPISATAWPTGNYAFEFRLPNYKTNRFETNLVDGANVTYHAKLEEMLSPIRLTANLEGVTVSATNSQGEVFGPWTIGTNGVLVSVSGTNYLVATYAYDQLGQLAPVILSNVAARVAFTNEYRLDFSFGTVVIRPPPDATVTLGKVGLTQRPDIIRFQPPDEASTYTVSAPHFETTNLPLAVAKGKMLVTNVVLAEKLYDLLLKAAPEVTTITSLPATPPIQRGANKLRWGKDGRYQITVSHPRLQSTTTNVTLAETGMTVDLSLDFAKASIDTRQQGLQVVMDGKENLGATPLPDLYLLPGSHRFVFTPPQRGTNVEWSYTFANHSTLVTNLPFQFMPAFLTNTIGLPLVYVSEMDIFVGKFEVTRREYASLMPPKDDAVACNTPGCPVVRVSWDEAVEFCRKLSAREEEKNYLQKEIKEGWTYRLPTLAEWKTFAPSNDVACFTEAVLFDPKTSDMNSMKPLPIQERQSFNKYGIYDLFGNVFEFCSGPNGEKFSVGGCFTSTKGQARKAVEQNPDAVAAGAPEYGFRVILKRGQ